jgi:hypothetical protein
MIAGGTHPDQQHAGEKYPAGRHEFRHGAGRNAPGQTGQAGSACQQERRTGNDIQAIRDAQQCPAIRKRMIALILRDGRQQKECRRKYNGQQDRDAVSGLHHGAGNPS